MQTRRSRTTHGTVAADRVLLLLFMVLAVLDVTGRAVYEFVRRRLPDSSPLPSSIEPFQYSARVIVEAFAGLVKEDR
jgi:uncharacterized membrane protein